MGTTSDLKRYRFYNDDGSESAATAFAAQDTNAYVDVTTGNVNLALRFGIQETGNAGNFGNGFIVEFSKNGGSWTPLTTGTSNVRGFNSSNLTDDGATSQRLTGGTGSFVAGKVTEDGASGGISLTALSNTEVLAALQLVAADLKDGDAIDLRAYQDGSTVVYTVIPRIVVVKNPNSKFFGMFFDGAMR